MLAKAASYADDKFTPWTGNPMYMGEWSLATIDEVQLTKAELTAFAKSLMDQYDIRAVGCWAFWAWRHDKEATKNPSRWSMRQLLREGIITIPTMPATRVRDLKCKAVFSHGSNKTKSSSDSGSASGSAKMSVELYKPKTVAPSDGNNNDETSAPTSAPAPASAAMRISALPSLIVLVAGSLVAIVLNNRGKIYVRKKVQEPRIRTLQHV